MTEIRKNPELGQCDKFSFIGAVIQAAQLGLEPGSGLGHAYLVPFRNKRLGITECTFIPGYRGLIDLARRSGQIESISARLVHEKDQFSYAYGDDERISHVPSEEKDPGRITHVYAIARLKGGGIQREILTRAQIDAVAKDTGPWKDHFDEMARKTAVRRIVKYLPMSPELARVIEADDAANEGTQEAWRAVAPDYEPAPPPHDPAKTREALATPLKPYASDGEAEADLQNARAEFEAMANAVTDKGGDVAKIIKQDPQALLDSTDTNRLLNASDLLKDWRP